MRVNIVRLCPCVLLVPARLSRMFGFRSVAYVRDYVQTLGNQQHDFDAKLNGGIENNAYPFWSLPGVFKPYIHKPKERVLSLGVECLGPSTVPAHEREILRSSQNVRPFGNNNRLGRQQRLPSFLRESTFRSIPNLKSIEKPLTISPADQDLVGSPGNTLESRQAYLEPRGRPLSYSIKRNEGSSLIDVQRAKSVRRLSPLREFSSSIVDNPVTVQESIGSCLLHIRTTLADARH